MAKIRTLPAQQFQAVGARLADNPDIATPEDLRRQVGEVVADSALADALARQLVSLWTLCARQEMSPAEILDGITTALAERTTWSDTDLAEWNIARPLLVSLLALPSVHLVAKGIDLQVEYANILYTTRLLTDVRPLFDDARNAILAGIISHTLVIEYGADSSSHSLHLALDLEDIQTLMDQCKSALSKAAATKALLSKCQVKPILPGSESDATS